MARNKIKKKINSIFLKIFFLLICVFRYGYNKNTRRVFELIELQNSE